MATTALVRWNVGDCRCIKLALVHDMAESVVGDITPDDNVSKEEKARLERDAMVKLCGMVRGCAPAAADEFRELWEEYEAASTPEAKFVKDLDKFDMILQAFEYEQTDNRPGELQTFFDSTADRFKTEQVKAWVSALNGVRTNSQADGSRGGGDSATEKAE